MSGNFKNVEERLHESLRGYYDLNNEFKKDVGYHVPTLKKICKQEDVDFDEFCEYMRNKLKEASQ